MLSKPQNCIIAKLHNSLDYGKTEDNKYIRYFHLSVLTSIFIPLGNIIIPLILWLTKRDKIIGLNEQGADLLNFQILWSLLTFGILTGSLFVYTDKYMNGSPLEENYLYPVLAIEAILFLLNFIYPVTISILIRRYGLRKYYYQLIRFVRL